jgi:pimeloyl-ACP methyl ester carboxylesterase
MLSRAGRLWLAGRLTGAGVLVALLLASPAQAARAGIVQLPVSFQVRNTNTTAVPCSVPDGSRYTVRGHITGPRSVLRRSAPPPITLYLTGLEAGESNWRFTRVPGYNWPLELAKLGQVSLTIDQLGYGASGHPWGGNVCYGTQADVAHQIVQQLRHGGYQVHGRAPVRFRRIAVAGHDIGGAFGEIDAYTYHDVDALILVSWSDQGQTPFILQRSFRAGTYCGEGGQSAYPGGPGEYFFMERPGEYAPDHIFYNFDPAVLAAFLRIREPNPCGYELPTVLATLAANRASLGQIHVPVLLAIGAEDPVWTQDGWSQQARDFTGTSDVTAVRLSNTGHYPMFERTAPRLRSLVARWLTRHGFRARVRRRVG